MYQKRGALAELSFNEVSTGLKNLTGHIVHPQPFNIFRCSQGTLNVLLYTIIDRKGTRLIYLL